MNKRNKNVENIKGKMVEEEIRRGTRRKGRKRKQNRKNVKRKMTEEKRTKMWGIL
jgi:hypothetical protein